MKKRLLNAFRFNEPQYVSCTMLSAFGVLASIQREQFSWIALIIGVLLWPTIAVIANYIDPIKDNER